jgi:hypothetical protein
MSWIRNQVNRKRIVPNITNINIESTVNNNINTVINMNIINRFNLFDFCVNSSITTDCYFIIGDNINGNSKTILGVKDNKIIIESNEWLHLLNKWYFNTNGDIYTDIIQKYRIIIKQQNMVEINESIFSLITSFCIGTIHGYSGLYCLLNNYIKNHLGKKVILYKHSQKGILDTVNAIFKNIYGDNFENYIIWLDHNIIYKFKEIIFTPNEHHTYNQSSDFRKEVDLIISEYIQPSLKSKEYYISLLDNKQIDHVCIFKSTNTQNVTNTSIIPFNDIEKFCIKNNATFFEPSSVNESDVIGILSNCKKFSTMLNNCFHKNYIYISDKCEEIDIYVITDQSLNEYNHFNSLNELLLQYKNAKINYILKSKLE